jgi:hypothetical protein
MLVRHFGQRIQAGTRAAGEDDAFHVRPLVQSSWIDKPEFQNLQI